MAKYRKMPVEVEAEQFWIDETPWPEGVERIGRHETDPSSRTGFRIHTSSGWVPIAHGEWVIIGAAGERCMPCADEIFRQSYERV